MRGADERSGSLFTLCGSGGAGWRRPSAAGDPADRRTRRWRRWRGSFGDVLADGPAVDPAGEVAAGDAAAGVLFDPLGTPADGAAGVRPSVPLVRGSGRSTIRSGITRSSRRTGTGCLEGEIAAKFLAAVLAQPHVKRLLSTRSLLGRRHADRGLGLDEELQAQGRERTSRRPRRRAQRKRSTSRARSARTRPTPRPTDPEARLYRKGPGMEAKLCFIGHALMENRNGSSSTPA